jgi:hypothetical protein
MLSADHTFPDAKPGALEIWLQPGACVVNVNKIWPKADYKNTTSVSTLVYIRQDCPQCVSAERIEQQEYRAFAEFYRCCIVGNNVYW